MASSHSTSLMVRLDDESKSYIAKAAELRHVSISDYVRMVTVSQAQREVREAEHDRPDYRRAIGVLEGFGPDARIDQGSARLGSRDAR